MFSLTLDFIDVKLNRVRADERARNHVLHTATLWGWRDPYNTIKERMRISKAACNQVAYDFGYPKPLAVMMLPYWYSKLNDSFSLGEDIDPLSPFQAHKNTYTDDIEEAHPGYLHEMFRYAQRVYGPMATFGELANCMNQKSGAPGEDHPTFALSRKQLG